MLLIWDHLEQSGVYELIGRGATDIEDSFNIICRVCSANLILIFPRKPSAVRRFLANMTLRKPL